MRRLALAGCLLACAEWRLPPTFAEQAAGRPVVHEQAVIGLSDAGDLAAAELLDADGEEPALTLLAFGRGGEPTRTPPPASPQRAGAGAPHPPAHGAEARAPPPEPVATPWPHAGGHPGGPRLP